MRRVLHLTSSFATTHGVLHIAKRRTLCNRWSMATELINVPALAEALGVDRSTVHRRIERGALKPTHYAGDQPLFTREAAQAILHGPVKPSEPAERAS